MRRGQEKLGAVLVLGLGKSGKSVARYCVDLLGTRVDRVFIAAGAESDDSRAFVESLGQPGVEYAFGDDAIEGDLGRFDICIASPGIPYWHALYQRGEQISEELVSEIEFSWRESDKDSTWVAITGTNGKTTTTSLAAHVLKESGFAANPVGNIGDVCLDAVAEGKTDVYVCEASSYQLASTRSFAPDVSVLLNITPDHVHWHKTLEAYRDAKFKLIDNVRAAAKSEGDRLSGAVAILDATNDVVRSKVRELKQMSRDQRGFDYVPVGTADGVNGDMRKKCGAENAAFMDESGNLLVSIGGEDHVLVSADDLRIKGEHNVGNALAAAAIAVALGADDGCVKAALKSFAPLEHRVEPCGTVRGVECYNDSKGTNTDATVKALNSFPGRRLMVLLGGDDKGTDLSDLIEAAHSNAYAAICYGASGPRFAKAFADAAADAPDGFRIVEASNMADAVEKGLSIAQPEDVLLLSPACASFDEFKSFEHRGEVFKQLVKDYQANQGK